MWIGSWKKKCWAARHNFLPIPGKTFQHGKKRETGGRVLNIFWVVQLIVSKKGENILLKGQFNITRLYPCLISKLGSFWTYIRSISFLPISTLSASATLLSLFFSSKPYHPLALALSVALWPYLTKKSLKNYGIYRSLDLVRYCANRMLIVKLRNLMERIKREKNVEWTLLSDGSRPTFQFISRIWKKNICMFCMSHKGMCNLYVCVRARYR